MPRADTTDGQSPIPIPLGSGSPHDHTTDATGNVESPDASEEEGLLDFNESGAEPDHSDSYEANSEKAPILRNVSFRRIELLSSWFPEVDPSHKRARGWRTWSSKRQNLLFFAFLTASTFLLANFACLVAFIFKFWLKLQQGQ
ncbi:hypothetical protein BCR34DRAFT_584234 [Clohesyomyces aquaticus]|uniref:Uncharacterized protein n=1 Tax=Clohesyomyces aquaticus TaxID=1231657 RepID=A0A1Y2A286_9PLEO|nr:hypothetical protein BCR34DRAFT_584234 [Clohesyomyces aquaticus]